VRQEDFAGLVDGVHEGDIRPVEFFGNLRLVLPANQRIGPIAEADRGERHRCQAFEVGRPIDPAAETLAQLEVIGDPSPQTFDAEVAEQHPQL
jgi:hypothetical protein